MEVTERWYIVAYRQHIFLYSLKLLSENHNIWIGGAMIPALNKMLQATKPIIDKISKWINDHKELTKGIMLSLTAFAGASLALGVLQKTIGGTILGTI
jgi:hypothetical protein